MGLIKKNILSIIFGVVAILCIILLFFPLGGMFESLRADVQQGWKVGTDLQNLTRTQRHWPSLSSDEEDKQPLEQFPTAALITKGEEMTRDWKASAERFLRFVIEDQNSQIQPLVKGILPTISSPAAGRSFIDQYQKRFGIYYLPNGQLDDSSSLFKQVLDSTVPPSEMDIKQRQDERAAQIRAERTIIQGGQVMNQAEVQDLVSRAVADIANEYRTESARKHLMYADPLTVFEINPKIAGTTVPSVNDVFLAQLTLWVQEQLCLAIRETNQAAHQSDPNRSPGVLGSPIKRLLKVQVTHKFVPIPAPPGTTEKPTLPSNPLTKITPDYTTRPFGHASNEFYDPVDFDATMIVDATEVSQILTSLNRNRYFIFASIDIQSVDASLDAVQGYLYGNTPVVQLRIKGSYLFLREVLKQYMPDDIIRGVIAPPPGEGGGYPGGYYQGGPPGGEF